MDDARPLLVFFFSERSGPARRMESLLAHLERKERERMRLQRVDVDRRPDLAERFRVAQVPTLALSPRIDTVRRCSLYWGVLAELNEEPDDTTALLDVCAAAAKRLGLAESGDKIGITAGLPVGRAGGTNLFKVQVVD